MIRYIFTALLFALTIGLLNSSKAIADDQAAAPEVAADPLAANPVTADPDVAADPEAPPLTVTLAADYYSDYVFRGLNFYPGTSIQPSIAPILSLGEYGNLSAFTWFNFSADGTADGIEEFFEYDQTIAYDITFGPATFSVGHIWYLFPKDSDEIPDTAEIFATVSIDTLLSPRFSFFHDYEELDYQYYEIGLSHKFEFEEAWVSNVTPFVNIGFATNAEKFYGEYGGYAQTTFGASAEIPLGPLTLQPHLAYTDGEAMGTIHKLWGGASLIYSF